MRKRLSQETVVYLLWEVDNVPRTVCCHQALARMHHPDKNPENKGAAELNFKRIAEAYSVLALSIACSRHPWKQNNKGLEAWLSAPSQQVLRDPVQRRAYDKSGRRSAQIDAEVLART
eukprot:6409070-Amphidinium_carterae.1